MTENYKLFHGDCLIESDNIENGTVDLILTDLPYGTVKGIGNSDLVEHGMKGNTEWDIVIDLDKFFDICNRILRKNGKMILFSQQPFTNQLINSTHNNVPFNYSMIWKKDHFANSLIAKKAPLNYYEDILVFSKTYDLENLHPLRQYFKMVLDYIGQTKKLIMDVIGQSIDHCLRIDSTQFELCTEKSYNQLVEVFDLTSMIGYLPYSELAIVNSTFNSTFNLWEGGKYKSNIFEYKKDYNGFHPTQKPVLLLEDLIKTFSNENNLVVDLTMGSGSTGVACMNTNRKFIGIEKDEGYFNIAKNRIEESLKVVNNSKREFF